MGNINVKYPNIEVELSGQDGNAYMIIGRVSKALRTNGVEEDQIKQFREEATSGNYDNLIQVCNKWVSVY
ncbi:MAG: hypothetical protein ACOCP8_02680 [archaeon]